jgi:hypothetical protein
MLNSITPQRISKPKSFSGNIFPGKENILASKLTNSLMIQGIIVT